MESTTANIIMNDSSSIICGCKINSLAPRIMYTIVNIDAQDEVRNAINYFFFNYLPSLYLYMVNSIKINDNLKFIIPTHRD